MCKGIKNNGSKCKINHWLNRDGYCYHHKKQIKINKLLCLEITPIDDEIKFIIQEINDLNKPFSYKETIKNFNKKKRKREI